MLNLSAIFRQLNFSSRRFFRSGQTNLRSVNLAYSVCNVNSNDKIVTNTPTMFIIHGLFGSKKNFDSLAKVFSKNTGLQVILVDARNHGDSEHSADMSYESMAGDVLELMRGLNVMDSIMLGHSMGGKVAMSLALLNPDVVKGLIVVDMVPAGSVSAFTDFFPRMIAKLKTINFDPSHDLSIVTARKMASEQLADVVKDKIVRDFLLTNLIQKEGRILWRLNLEAIGNYYNSLMEFPEFTGRCYEGKTIFIGGSKSDMITDKHQPIIKKFFPNSETTHIEGSGHWVHADNPQKFSELTIAFIKGLMH